MGYIDHYTAKGKIERRYTSHEGVDHDSLDGLGYDWEQVGDPGIAPKYPLKIYLPQSTEDIVAIVREVKALGQKLTIRSRGHSSNDLVLADKGVVLCTGKLNRVLEINEREMTATLQAGVISADVDELLRQKGYGLPVIGDHNDITVGGFSSVGGIGPASHRYGMFIDNVAEFEYVNFDGDVIRCSRTENAADFYRVLGGCGQYGVLATLTCRFIKIDKYGTILRNERAFYTNLDRFLRETSRHLRDPGDIYMMRGAFNNLGKIKIGQFSGFKETPQSGWKSLRNTISYRYLHMLGSWAGRLPALLERVVKALGILGVLFPARYASIKNVEFFADRILDVTVGDPTRWLIILVPSAKYEALARAVYERAVQFRERYGCFTFVSIYIKAVRSEFLSPEDPHRFFCELNLYLGISKRGIRTEELDDLVSQVDDLCIKHGAFRYMHSKTVKDPERRRQLDLNSRFAQTVSAAGKSAVH